VESLEKSLKAKTIQNNSHHKGKDLRERLKAWFASLVTTG
jgi:hypothetical protein